MKTSRPSGEFLQGGAPARGGIEMALSNKTPLAGLKGKVRADCSVCGTSFMRHYSLLAKYANHYCSKSCFGLANRRPTEFRCALCGALGFTRPNRLKADGMYCSNGCLDLSRRLRRFGEVDGSYAEVLGMRKEGASFVEIGRVLGCSAQSAAYKAKKAVEHAGLLLRVEERRTRATESEAAVYVGCAGPKSGVVT